MNPSLFGALTLVSLLATGCSADASRHLDITRAEEEVRAQSKRWLGFWQAGATDSLATLLTEDAVIVRAHHDPLMGRAQVAFYVRQRQEVLRDDVWEPTSVLVSPAFDVAVERGVYRRLDRERGTDISIGNYVSVYRRDGDEWRLLNDAKWLTDIVVGDSLCRATGDGTGGHRCRARSQ
jgi:ketosteroid isomerase-like protein